MLYRVYVDEAGDRDISAASNQHFVVSAVIVADACDVDVRAQLAELRTSLTPQPLPCFVRSSPMTSAIPRGDIWKSFPRGFIAPSEKETPLPTA
jgi:hypothetical protein